MDRVQTIELKETILENNDADAELLREELRKQGLLYINIMSSPGSGKTSVLLQTVKALKEDCRIGVMEADIDSAVDAETIMREGGVPAVQLHTGGMCHLDAAMSRQGLAAMEAEQKKNSDSPLDLVFLENVGNLVCPAEFDTGSHLNVAILSITEGHDKPLKYPLMFELCDAVLINKIDAAPICDFDFEAAKQYILKRNPNARIFPLSAKTGEGVADWTAWLKLKMEG
ncbi:MAG: hydrogenase nickel incorporation protein HypB [Lachnospiraceae bacterium]|nr:hydrogenase nickel incorporation protein HypB [Lachnospiraceae bacterium]